MRRCTKCGILLPTTAFPIATSKGGSAGRVVLTPYRRNWCPMCLREYYRERKRRLKCLS